MGIRGVNEEGGNGMGCGDGEMGDAFLLRSALLCLLGLSVCLCLVFLLFRWSFLSLILLLVYRRTFPSPNCTYVFACTIIQ